MVEKPTPPGKNSGNTEMHIRIETLKQTMDQRFAKLDANLTSMMDLIRENKVVQREQSADIKQPSSKRTKLVKEQALEQRGEEETEFDPDQATKRRSPPTGSCRKSSTPKTVSSYFETQAKETRKRGACQEDDEDSDDFEPRREYVLKVQEESDSENDNDEEELIDSDEEDDDDDVARRRKAKEAKRRRVASESDDEDES